VQHPPTTVTPAQAGAQLSPADACVIPLWVPAFAGMTVAGARETGPLVSSLASPACAGAGKPGKAAVG
jgi:hypothetical protein